MIAPITKHICLTTRSFARSPCGKPRLSSWWSALTQTGQSDKESPCKAVIPEILMKQVRKPLGLGAMAIAENAQNANYPNDTLKFYQRVLPTSSIGSGATTLHEFATRLRTAAEELEKMEKEGMVLESPVTNEGEAFMVTLDENLGKKYGMVEMEGFRDDV